VSTAYHTVHVRVNDPTTGQPTPVRIRFTGPDGTYLAPFGRSPQIPTGPGEDVGGNLLWDNKEYAYIDGGCEIRLPGGPITVEVRKGPAYQPLHREVTLGPGKMALRLAVQRWIDLRSQGWYSGDTHVCCLTPQAALLEGAAEDLAVVNLLASESPGPRFSNILSFSGQRPALEMPGCLVVVNTLNQHPILGSLALLHSHRVVYPLRFGTPFDDWTLADWCDQCHRKKGLVIWTNAFDKPGEALADVILGKVDAIEATAAFADDANSWYRLLNCGFRVPLVGGSGKTSNAVPLGEMRTFALLRAGDEFSYANWIEAVRAGRTFATNGPLVFCRVNGQDPGAVIELGGDEPTVRVHAEVRSGVPFDRLEVVVNGHVVASQAATGTYPAMAFVDMDLPVTTSGWLAMRCRGISGPFAHTSPVYLSVADRPMRADPVAAASLAGDLDKMADWVAREGRFENDRQREQLAAIFRDALVVLRERSTV
jgi:hypothetical protein